MQKQHPIYMHTVYYKIMSYMDMHLLMYYMYFNIAQS